MSYYAKVHLYEGEKIIAVCDGKLMGQKIPHNGIELNISDRFYGQLEYSENEILTEAKTATSINAMGKNICNLLVENHMVHPASIMWIEHEGEQIGHVIVVN